jgi:HSP20 family protein
LQRGEDEKEVKIKAELPGLEEKDVEVTLGEDILTIKGEKREDKEEKGEGRWYREPHYGSFSRVIPLPKGLNQEKVDARFKNGVLSITLPRFEVSESKKKKISVEAMVAERPKKSPPGPTVPPDMGIATKASP